MISREIKMIMETIGQLDNISKGLDINKEAVSKHSSTLTEVRNKLSKYTEQYNNAEYMKTLSPPEQQNLMKNARALYEVHEKLVKELDYLDMSKQPPFIVKAISALDKAYLFSQYLYEEVLKPCGDIVIPHFTCIQVKHIDKASYKQLVLSITTELETFANDLYNSHIPTTIETGLHVTTIYTHLIESYMWFKKENERLSIEALPEINKIDIPEESVLEVPTQPEEVKP